ncbi:hypothetical protein [Mesorhizobium sp. WSM3860]|uniref:hypothetical protein n=1 Tax=Mesorhizobium sp. WSM3860 TaxID=2029403 RepID=UPI00159684C3|nr:hypothetical protein [Mesorhizobium sp. WSM3860]
MEHALDDLARILKTPQTRLRDRYGALVLRLAESLAAGLAMGVGFAIVHFIAN